MSMYVPTWVKSNPTRFPRAETSDKATGKRTLIECLSLFNDESLNADTKAFKALLQHLKEFDAGHETVIMVQVQNEVGLLGDSRDRSDAAQTCHESTMPADLLSTLRTHTNTLRHALQGNIQHLFDAADSNPAPTWEEAFGPGSLEGDEMFMAYHYARYLERIAKAGKDLYDIPLYTNAWLRNVPDEDDPATCFPALLGGGAVPGEYPSGGAVETVLDIRQLFAPSLDFIAPDIYLSHYEKTCVSYRHRNQPLFIPEQRRDEPGALRMWAAVGTYGALGVSPFGIDSNRPEAGPFTPHYQLLQQVTPQILQARAEGRSVHGFFFDRFEPGSKDPSSGRKIQMGDWSLQIDRAWVWGHPAPGYGLIIQLDHDRFLLVGEGFQVSFASVDPKAVFSGIMTMREKEVSSADQSALLDGRWLNGDELLGGRCAVMPSEDPDYGDFFICSWISSRTRIAECRPYSF